VFYKIVHQVVDRYRANGLEANCMITERCMFLKRKCSFG